MTDIVLKVLEIRIVLPGNQPILLLLDQQSQRLLRLWIGPSEGTAIGLAQQGIETPRPTTHRAASATRGRTGDGGPGRAALPGERGGPLAAAGGGVGDLGEEGRADGGHCDAHTFQDRSLRAGASHVTQTSLAEAAGPGAG